ncbi:hypothetical protein BRARA_C03476 [Brassica rapa]|uniref:Uncharacterized protein n=1 Tax=Brassica campestris TaxID=3711 RepID=A0A398A899_BRACM|nr:hypothetical protein BRARA_C03476 [Brassica rapa]
MKKVSATATTNPSDASSSFFQFPTWQPPQQSMRTPVGDEAPPPQGYTSKAYSLWPPGTSHGDGKLYGGYAHGYDVGYDDGYAAGYSDMQSRATGNGVAYSSVPSSSNYPSNPCYPGVRQPSSFTAYDPSQGLDVIRRGPRNHGTENQKTILEKKAK